MDGARPRSPRVLVGDEEPLVGNFVREALRLSGYEVEVSRDEAGFLRAFLDRAFELLILDFHMARRSAFQGIISVRERDPAVPIILMAGGNRSSSPDAFAFTYRVHILRKPFGAKGLRDAVERALPQGGC